MTVFVVTMMSNRLAKLLVLFIFQRTVSFKIPQSLDEGPQTEVSIATKPQTPSHSRLQTRNTSSPTNALSWHNRIARARIILHRSYPGWTLYAIESNTWDYKSSNDPADFMNITISFKAADGSIMAIQSARNEMGYWQKPEPATRVFPTNYLPFSWPTEAYGMDLADAISISTRRNLPGPWYGITLRKTDELVPVPGEVLYAFDDNDWKKKGIWVLGCRDHVMQYDHENQLSIGREDAPTGWTTNCAQRLRRNVPKAHTPDG